MALARLTSYSQIGWVDEILDYQTECLRRTFEIRTLLQKPAHHIILNHSQRVRPVVRVSVSPLSPFAFKETMASYRNSGNLYAGGKLSRGDASRH